MNFDLSLEQQMLLDGARRFLRENYGLARAQDKEGAKCFDQAIWSACAQMGWLRLPFGEAAGGLGGGSEDIALLMTAFGEALVIEPYVTSVILSGTILERSHTEMCMALIEAIGSGEALVTLAHDERGGEGPVSDGPATNASVESGGFRISGFKRAVIDGPSAHHFIVSANLDGQLGLFLVPADAIGIVTEAYPLIDGTWAADILFADAHVEPGALLVRGDRAHQILAEALDVANLANLAQSVGSIEAMLDLCGTYLKTREQFGRPIGQFQALQHIMAQMFVEAQEARSILYFAIANRNAAAKDRARAIRQARIVIGDAGQLISRQAIQLHGAYGITEEFAIGHHYKRMLALEKLFGDTAGFLDQEALRVAGEIFPG